MDVGNLISDSFAFSKTSLNIWKCMLHVLLKPGLDNFEHYFTSVWDECSCVVVWAFFGIEWIECNWMEWIECNWMEWIECNWMTWAFLGIGIKTDLFQSCGHCWVFQICWHIDCSIFTVSSFRIWNSSTGIPSPPLALFLLMLPKAHLTWHSRMSGSRSHHRGYLGHENLFCIVLLCILATS